MMFLQFLILFIELLYHIYIDYNLIDPLALIQRGYSRSYRHSEPKNGARTANSVRKGGKSAAKYRLKDCQYPSSFPLPSTLPSTALSTEM